MNPIYNTGIRLYSAAARLVSANNPKAARMVAGQHSVDSCLAGRIGPDDRPVWVHAASLGEFEQGRPLIEKLRARFPKRKILLTFFSPSGYEVRKAYDKVDAVCYLPFDTPANARRFVEMVNPSIAIFVKYEFWGNYLQTLYAKHIPTYLISAIFRPNQIFFRWYGGMFRNMLRCYDHLFVQDERSRRLLASIGVTNVTVAGDTRFDRVTDILKNSSPTPVLEDFRTPGSTVLVVGSSWEADEDRYMPWLNSRKDVKAVIAPHEFDEARLRRIASRIEGKTVRLSELEANPEAYVDARCVIVDCFGRLSALYRYGDIAYVGGGFGTGIHNINEAAVYGMPVVFGPKHDKFKEASDLIECGGGFSANDAESLSDTLTRLVDDRVARRAAGESAGHYIATHLGATDKILKHIIR